MREAGIEPEAIPYNYDPSTETPQNPVLEPLIRPLPQPPVIVPVAPVQGVISSSKTREAAGYLIHPTPPSTLGSDPGLRTGSVVSGGPSTGSTAPSAVLPVSSMEVEGLRVEMENLRRAMQELQGDRLDAPPGYQDVQSQGPH